MNNERAQEARSSSMYVDDGESKRTFFHFQSCTTVLDTVSFMDFVLEDTRYDTGLFNVKPNGHTIKDWNVVPISFSPLRFGFSRATTERLLCFFAPSSFGLSVSSPVVARTGGWRHQVVDSENDKGSNMFHCSRGLCHPHRRGPHPSLMMKRY